MMKKKIEEGGKIGARVKISHKVLFFIMHHASHKLIMLHVIKSITLQIYW